MKLRRHATLFLAIMMLLQCVVTVPAMAAGEDSGTVLYSTVAPASAGEAAGMWISNSNKAYTSNFEFRGIDKQIKLVEYYNNHDSGQGLPLDSEGNIVNMEFKIPKLELKTSEWGEMELTFQYVIYNNYIDINLANDFQVYVSTDGGKTWSENYAGMKDHTIVGVGNGSGGQGRCYDVVSEDLTALVDEGKVINAIKIRPYGDFFGHQYNTCVSGISVKGYKDKAPGGAEEIEYIEVDEYLLRQIVVDHAYQVALIPWKTDKMIDTYNASGQSSYDESVTQHYMPGWLYKGPAYSRGIDSTLEMWLPTLDAEGNYSGGKTDSSVVGWDCIQVVSEAWSRISTAKGFLYHLYCWQADDMPMVGGLKNEPVINKSTEILRRHSEQEVYEAYAQLKIGDHLLTSGHSRLVTVYPTVVRNADGTIDPDQSKVSITEEAGTIRYHWLTPAGKIVRSEEKNIEAYQAAHPDYTYLYGSSMRVDRSFTFGTLWDTGYVPYTLKEFLEGRVEKQRVSIKTDMTADNVVENGLLAYVESNYHVAETVYTLSNAAGETIYTGTKYGETHDFDVGLFDDKMDAALKSLGTGNYKLTVDVRSGPVTKILGKIPVTRVFELDFTV